jgi:hypothetical protein
MPRYLHPMKPFPCLLVALAVATFAYPPIAQAAEPKVTPAIDGVLAAFDDHPIVALGDAHSVAEEGAFYAALVLDPRFADKVGNLVVEFGGAAHQDIIDRYVNGEAVSYEELRSVWTDVVGWVPTVTASEYPAVFAAVRAANASRPAAKRIRVWLGEPPIDWAKIHTRKDLSDPALDRTDYPVRIIEREILAKGKKALVIYGAAHFRQNGAIDRRVEEKYPNSFFVIFPHFLGFEEATCERDVEANFSAWPIPALATPIRGTTLAAVLRPKGCTRLGAYPSLGAHPTPELIAQRAASDEPNSGVPGDALLYLGPASSLMVSPRLQDLYLDLDYFREISRRTEIMTGQPLDWNILVKRNVGGVQTNRQRLTSK